MNNCRIKSVLFDLDGTLVDSAEDLTSALNSLLKIRHIPTLPTSQTRAFAGRGSKGLLKIGLNIDDNHPDFLELSTEFFEHYQIHLIETTQLFSGMPQVLHSLKKKNIPWGIVTNKPQRFTDVLVKHIPLLQQAKCIVSGDTLEKRKPHPDPILYACRLLNQTPADCLYIGDAEVDIVASNAAGTHSLVALYGYIPAEEEPFNWNADGYIQHPLDILEWLRDPEVYTSHSLWR